MTYFNGNPYVGPTPSAPLDQFAHDCCLPDNQFTVTTIAAGLTGGTVAHRQQNWPWHWAPVWGAPQPCYVCGQDVELGPAPGRPGLGLYRPGAELGPPVGLPVSIRGSISGLAAHRLV